MSSNEIKEKYLRRALGTLVWFDDDDDDDDVVVDDDCFPYFIPLTALFNS